MFSYEKRQSGVYQYSNIFLLSQGRTIKQLRDIYGYESAPSIKRQMFGSFVGVC
jgi:hypothetical protein